MPVISTDTPRLSNTLKMEFAPERAYCRTVGVINDTAATLTIGTVLGKVTATGKYKVCVQTAVDGSEVAAAVLLEDKTVAGATDTKALLLVRGPAAVSKGGLVLHSSHDLDTKKAAVYAALEAKGILVLDAA